MTAMLIAVLTASLLGSVHCAGMCGPFCGVAVGGGGRAGGVTLHLAYHLGRLLTYCLLGAAAGTVGALVDLASTLAGLQPIALGLAGGAMVLFGLGELARLRGWRLLLPAWRPPHVWTRLMQRGQQFAARKSGVTRAATIGLLTTLLPCGWLYAFVVTAAGSGSAVGGILVMAAFWIGTVPILLSLGVGVRKLAGVVGDRLPAVTAVALVVVGVVTLSGRLSLSPTSLAATVAQDAQSTQDLEGTTNVPDANATPACCRARQQAEGRP